MVKEKVLAQGRVLYIADDITGHRLNSNCIVKVERALSKETVYTNEYGWRVPSKRDSKNKKSKYTFAGCSLCMGTGNDYEDSIIGQIEKKIQFKIK